jgi:hypothetical protein
VGDNSQLFSQGYRPVGDNSQLFSQGYRPVGDNSQKPRKIQKNMETWRVIRWVGG